MGIILRGRLDSTNLKYSELQAVEAWLPLKSSKQKTNNKSNVISMREWKKSKADHRKVVAIGDRRAQKQAA